MPVPKAHHGLVVGRREANRFEPVTEWQRANDAVAMLEDIFVSFQVMNYVFVQRLCAFGVRKLVGFLHLLLFPFMCLAVIVYSAAKGRKYYFAEGETRRIGGWAITIDALLRRTKNDSKYKDYVFIVHHKIANSFFYELMKRQVTVVENPVLSFLLLSLARIENPLRVADKLDYIRPEEVGQYPPVGWFSEQDHARGRDLLKQLGICGKDTWYVCFFARDNAYYEAHSSGAELDYIKAYHSRRNSDINAQIPAMKFIIDRGGYVIRVGRIASKPVGFSHPRLVDYPFSPYRSDFADIYLPCHGKFLIGDGSGVACMSAIVDMPRGWINSELMNSCFPESSLVPRKNVIYIPKLMRFRDSGKYVTINDYRRLLCSSTAGSIVNYIEAVKRNNIVHEDNSEEDILLVTAAMYNEFVAGNRGAGAQGGDFFDAGLNHGNEIWPEFLKRHPELLQ